MCITCRARRKPFRRQAKRIRRARLKNPAFLHMRLAVMTEYLHEKTALLPRIKIREERAVVGKNTEQAMRIGAEFNAMLFPRAMLGKELLAMCTPKSPAR